MSRPTGGSDPDRAPSRTEKEIHVFVPGFEEWERRHAERRGGTERSTDGIVRTGAPDSGRTDGDNSRPGLQGRHGRCPDG